MPDRRSDSGRRRSPSSDRKRRRTRSRSRRRSPARRSRSRSKRRSPIRRSPRRRSRSPRSRRSRSRSPRRASDRRGASSRERRSPRRSSPRRRSHSPRRKSPRRDSSPRKPSAASPARRKSRSRSRQRTTRSDRPEVREAESSTQPSTRRDERRRSRSPREKEDPSTKTTLTVPKKLVFGKDDILFRSDISKGTNRKRKMLCQRFMDEDDEPFEAPENITIGIERNIRGNSPAVIRKEISPEAVEVHRRKDEGTVPLSQRDEFKTIEPVSEKRVIKMDDSRRRRSRSPQGLSDRWREREPVVIRDDSFRIRELDERYGIRDTVREDDSRVVRDTGRRYEDLRSGRYDTDPHDLRHNLLSRRRSEPEPRRDDPRDLRSRLGNRGRDTRGGGGLRVEIRGGRDGRGDRERERDRDRRKSDDKNLPDFKERPGKGAEWLLDPEQIPTSGIYFQHDNRDRAPMFMRGRGRGRGFRGGFRGGYRGGRDSYRDSYREPYRGDRDRGDRDRERGFALSRGFGSSEGEWLHDKFAENDKVSEEEDNNPTSTSEK